jgi:hypothetical protein
MMLSETQMLYRTTFGALLIVCGLVLAGCGDDQNYASSDPAVDTGDDAGMDAERVPDTNEDAGTDIGADPVDDAGTDIAGDADPPDDTNFVTGDELVDLLIDEFCGPLVEVFCSAADRCQCGIEYEVCAAEQLAGCAASQREFAREARRGGIGLRIDFLRACVEHLEATATGCAAPNIFGRLECFAMFASDDAPGERCNSSRFCARGDGICTDAGCVLLPTRNEPCLDGICQPGLGCFLGICGDTVSEGSSCQTPFDCMSPLQCLPVRNGDSGVCRGPKDLGEPCFGTQECAEGTYCGGGVCIEGGDSCVPEPCGNGYFCVNGAACQAFVSEEDPCLTGDACGADHYCRFADQLVGTCAQRPIEGESCERGPCGPDLGCHQRSLRCIPAPAEGEECARGPEGPLCAEGLSCREEECIPTPGAGDRCADYPACAEGLGCDYGDDEPVCVEQRTEGFCQNPEVCAPGFFCDWDVERCTPRREIGERCDGAECLEGTTCLWDDETDTASCAPIPGEGERCSGECSTGTYCGPTEGPCVPGICLVLNQE